MYSDTTQLAVQATLATEQLPNDHLNSMLGHSVTLTVLDKLPRFLTMTCGLGKLHLMLVTAASNTTKLLLFSC